MSKTIQTCTQDHSKITQILFTIEIDKFNQFKSIDCLGKFEVRKDHLRHCSVRI